MSSFLAKFTGAFLGSFAGMCGAIVLGLRFDEWDHARRKARQEAMLRHPASGNGPVVESSAYNPRRAR